MAGAVSVVAAATVVFAVTNIDDLVVLTVWFSSPQLGRREIVAGQYLGFGAIVALSVIGAVGLLVVPERWVGLLGVIPLALGIRGLLHRSDDQPVMVAGVLGVAGVTLANGADNISVYVPLFRKVGGTSLVYIAVFMVFVVVWCAIAAFLARRNAVIATMARYGHWLVPVVFIVIGAVLLAGVFR